MMENSSQNVTGIAAMSRVKQVTIFALALAVLIPVVGYLKQAPKEPAAAEQSAPVGNGRDDLQDVMQKAHAGDYQAQRNLAYGFAAYPYNGQEKNPVLACAWYLVVLNSGSPQVDEGDKGNVNVYCGRLDAEQLGTAKSRASQLIAEIYRR